MKSHEEVIAVDRVLDADAADISTAPIKGEHFLGEFLFEVLKSLGIVASQNSEFLRFTGWELLKLKHPEV